MSDDSTARSLLQYVLFLALLVVGLSPFLLMLWKNAGYRQRMSDLLRCRDCTDCCARRVHYDAADLQTLRELEQPQRESVGINGAYRLYQARRSARLSLRLASWREDIKKNGDDDELHHKLAQIQAAQMESRPVAQAQAPTASTARPAIATPTLPFDIRIVSINHRVDESSSSSTASGATADAISVDISDDESVYELVPPTPREEAEARVTPGRRSVVTAEEEEEEKDDGLPPREHQIV